MRVAAAIFGSEMAAVLGANRDTPLLWVLRDRHTHRCTPGEWNGGLRTLKTVTPSRSKLQEQMTELVERQAAISEVLRATASSPHDLQPIFDTILVNATRLCRAPISVFLLFEEHGFRVVARSGTPNLHNESFPIESVFHVSPGTPFARVVEGKSPVHTVDLAADQAYRERDPRVVSLVEVVGVRTELLVPMLQQEELIGAIGLVRTEVQPFTDRQIDLITDFATQATIALESTRRERQYREVQVELAHANRLATIGQLTTSIVHELTQPLAAAHTNASAGLRFFDKNPPDLEEMRDALARIVRGTDRARAVVDRIGALVKKAPPRKEILDLNEAILEVTTLTHSEAIKTGVTVRTQLAPRLPRIEADRVQLQQVVLNLIMNAIQAMSGVAEDRRELQISTETAEPEGVRVGVLDTGPGLSPETLPRLFEPFYTTKHDGMGIGLSICRSIVETHGGRLWASGCEPHGALFQFTIPTD